MTSLQIVVLGAIQGLAELLPVSSSAHVIVAEKMMGLDPSTPENVFLLIMFHTGTMFSVFFVFLPKWKEIFHLSRAQNPERDRLVKISFIRSIISATFLTGVVGIGLKVLIEKAFMRNIPGAEIELLFRSLPLISAALIAAGFLIIFSSNAEPGACRDHVENRDAAIIGIVQGVCLPFRGFSRSGATISTGFIRGLSKETSEAFSFALAVALTPAVILYEMRRLLLFRNIGLNQLMIDLLAPSLLGLGTSFVAGVFALRWLSGWIESGRWKFFGYYCIAAAICILAINHFTTLLN